MSYRNPQIITDRSGEILAEGFKSFSSSMASGITKQLEAQEKYRKEEAERIRKANELKTLAQMNGVKEANEINKGLAETTITGEVEKTITSRIMTGADVKQKLNVEFDDIKRNELLKEYANTKAYIDKTSGGLSILAEDVSAYSETDPEAINNMAFSGNTPEERSDTQGFLAAMSGGLAKENFKITTTQEGEDFFVEVTGKIGLGEEEVPFTKKVNVANYGEELMFELVPFKDSTIEAGRAMVKDEKGDIKETLMGLPSARLVEVPLLNKNNEKIGVQQMQGTIQVLDKKIIDAELKGFMDASIGSFNKLDMRQKEAIIRQKFLGNPDAIFKNENGTIASQDQINNSLRALMEPQITKEILGDDFKQGTINGVKDTWYRGNLAPVAATPKDKPTDPAIRRAIDKKDKQIFGESLIENANKFSGGGDKDGTLKQFMNEKGDVGSDQIEAYGRAASIPNTVITKAPPVFKTEQDSDGNETQVQINLNEFIVANDRTGKQVPFNANQGISPEDIEGFAMTAYGFNATEVAEFKRRKAAFQKRTEEAKAKAEARRKGLINRE